MEYLIGIGILSVIWLGLFLYRPEMQRAMIWGGWLYVFVLSVGFITIKLIWPDLPAERTIVPGYWDPNTLFDLGRRTGGYAVEDALYGFFTAGVAVAVYEEFFRKHLGHRHAKHKPHLAITVAAMAGFVTAYLNINLIYSLIVFGFVGAVVIWLQRNDLIKHSFYGGVSYLLVYIGMLLLFLQIFPDYIHTQYSLANLLGVMLLDIPIEEYLFALSFGLMWSPIYEYMKDTR